LAFPGWDAAIVQEPAPVRCTVVPLTVQLPLAAKATGRPELAVAPTLKSASPYVLFASGPNVIDCDFGAGGGGGAAMETHEAVSVRQGRPGAPPPTLWC